MDIFDFLKGTHLMYPKKFKNMFGTIYVMDRFYVKDRFETSKRNISKKKQIIINQDVINILQPYFNGEVVLFWNFDKKHLRSIDFICYDRKISAWEQEFSIWTPKLRTYPTSNNPDKSIMSNGYWIETMRSIRDSGGSLAAEHAVFGYIFGKLRICFKKQEICVVVVNMELLTDNNFLKWDISYISNFKEWLKNSGRNRNLNNPELLSAISGDNE